MNTSVRNTDESTRVPFCTDSVGTSRSELVLEFVPEFTLGDRLDDTLDDTLESLASLGMLLPILSLELSVTVRIAYVADDGSFCALLPDTLSARLDDRCLLNSPCADRIIASVYVN
jgi:hypothetical protein